MVGALVPNLTDRPRFTGSLKAVVPLSPQSSIYLVHVHKWRLNLRLHYCAHDVHYIFLLFQYKGTLCNFKFRLH